MKKYHTVKQGECISSLASKYGFENYRTIYEHPKNTELKEERPNPNVLKPHDEVYIPEIEIKEVDAETEQRHIFVLKREKTFFRIIVRDENFKPFVNVRYEMTVDGKKMEGKTDGSGKIEREINAEARNGYIVLRIQNETGDEIPIVIPLEFRHLDPPETVSGIQGRLHNLGYGSGKITDKLNKKTEAALRRFQEKNNLPPTGEPCAATCDKLRQMHDWQ